MSYHFSKTVSTDFESAINKVTEELKKEGFGVLTQIDFSGAIKNKLDIDMPKYIILGACNPGFAYQAVTAEEEIGTMLPCNVVVRENKEGSVIVSAVDPIASMMAIQNEYLGKIAGEVADKLKRVINNL